MRQLRRWAEGFTLIEMMVTVVIIGILAAIAFGMYDTFRMAAMRAEPKGGLGMMVKLQELYRIEHGSYMDDELKLTRNSDFYGAGQAAGTANSCSGNKLGFKLKSCKQGADEGGPRYRYFFGHVDGEGYVAVAHANKEKLGIECTDTASAVSADGEFTDGGSATAISATHIMSSTTGDVLQQSDIDKVYVARNIVDECV